MKHFLYGILTGIVGMAIAAFGMVVVFWALAHFIKWLPLP